MNTSELYARKTVMASFPAVEDKIGLVHKWTELGELSKKEFVYFILEILRTEFKDVL